MSPTLRRTRNMLVPLIILDVCFVALYAIWILTRRIPEWVANIAMYWGLPEIFQFTKEAAIVLLAALLFFKIRQSAYAVVGALMTLLWINDMAYGHETLGGVFASKFGYQPAIGLRAQDFGELTAVAIYIAIFLPLLIWSYWRSHRPERRFLHQFFGLMVALAIVGILFDMLAIAVDNPFAPYFSWTALEEGGEMIVMSCIVAFMFYYWQHPGHAALPRMTDTEHHTGEPARPMPGKSAPRFAPPPETKTHPDSGSPTI